MSNGAKANTSKPATKPLGKLVFGLVYGVIVLVACSRNFPSPNPPSHNLNLHQVGPGVWRSAQPASSADWQTIKNLGVQHVAKLDYDAEGNDQGGKGIGLDVHELGIEPKSATGTVIQPDDKRVNQAVQILMNGQALVHCLHGQDRTGLVVGIYRLRHDHWTKAQAYKEMVDNGFHPILRGLSEFWEDRVTDTGEINEPSAKRQ